MTTQAAPTSTPVARKGSDLLWKLAIPLAIGLVLNVHMRRFG